MTHFPDIVTRPRRAAPPANRAIGNRPAVLHLNVRRTFRTDLCRTGCRIARLALSCRRMRPFWELDLGKPDARKEKALLRLSGFVDPGGIINELLNGDKFVVLGPKGTGKSAIACHIVERSRNNYDLFASEFTLTDLMCRSVEDMAKTSDSSQSVTWRALLLLQVVNSLLRDASARVEGSHESLTHLSKLGLLSVQPGRGVVDWKFSGSIDVTTLGKLGGSVERITRERSLSVAGLVTSLETVIGQIATEHRHLVFIDGLDDVFSWKEIPFAALGSLVDQVDYVNQILADSPSPSKVILLCRTDLFPRLPGSNKNKVRIGSGMSLNWYEADPGKSNLCHIANQRARLSDDTIKDLFIDYFSRVKLPNMLGIMRKVKDIRPVLLKYTRHTPRDFGALLASIQEVCKARRQPTVDTASFESGLRDYSSSYFPGEVRDELDGYFTPDQIDGIVKTLTAIRVSHSRFRMNVLMDYASRLPSMREVDLEKALTLLYDCSAIGMVVQNLEQRAVEVSFQFRCNAPSSNLDSGSTMILHPALAMGAVASQPNQEVVI